MQGALEDVAGVEKVEVDFQRGRDKQTVTVTGSPNVDAGDLVEAVEGAGFGVSLD